jgi:uncharacterized membrane protein (DUF106 family)
MFNEILSLYIKILDSFLFPLLLIKPVLAISIISIIFSLFSIGISLLTVDKERMRKIKEKMSSLQEKMKIAQKEMNKEALIKIFEETIKVNFQMFRLKSKSILTILFLTIFIFPWLDFHFKGVSVAKLPFSIPIIGSDINWILWYIFVSLTINYIAQKILGLKYV